MFGKRFTRALVVMATASLIMATAALADVVVGDGDGVEPISHSGTPLALGAACASQDKEGTALIAIRRQSNTNSGTVFANSSSVTLSATASSGLSVEFEDGNVIGLPSDWVSQSPNTMSGHKALTVTLNAVTNPAFSGTVTLTATGTNAQGGGTLVDTNTMAVTANVANCAPVDTTPPTITPNTTGTLGTNGWYTSDVDLSWTIVDNESAITSSAGCGSVSITTDQAATTYACTATSAGGTSSESVTIKRDATAPEVEYTSADASAPGGGPNAAGWYKSDVIATFTATDNLSGFDAAGTLTDTDTATTSGEGSTVTVLSPAFTDHAGNTAAAGAATSDPFMIDKTAPVVSVTGVSNGATYTLGSVPTAGCSTTETLSGVKTATQLSFSGGPVGSVTATCSAATDNADNTGVAASVIYSVEFDFDGFFQPVDNMPAWNSAKAGQSIPLKFSLGGAQGLGILDGAPKLWKVSCPNASADVVPIFDSETSTANNGLTYDPLSDQYNYVWKTDKRLGGMCYQVDVKLIDGTTHSALFAFKK